MTERKLSFSLEAGRHVLIAVDSMETSRLAFEWYINDVMKAGDKVVLCHVQQPPTLSLFSFSSGSFAAPTNDWADKLKDEAEKGKKMMEEYEHMCEKHGLHKESIVKMGKPGEMICETANEVQADMILLGTRNNSKMKRTFLGSTANYVLQHSDVTVTVVPPLAIKERTNSQTRRKSRTNSMGLSGQ